jgi:hypothetical protein
MDFLRGKEEWDKEVFITQDYDEKLRVKIEQWHQESINVKIIPNTESSWPQNIIIDPTSQITANIGKTVKVDINSLPNSEWFLFNDSREFRFSSRTLLTLWILWVMYWKYNITISGFLWITIKDDSANLPWFIWLLIFMELIIFLSIFMRDVRKFWVENTLKIFDKENNLRMLQKDKKNFENEIKSQGSSIELEKKLENCKRTIKVFDNQLEGLRIEKYNNYLILLWLKISLPFSIWILGLVLNWEDFTRKIYSISWFEIIIFACSFFTIYLAWKYFLERYSDVEKREIRR